jgi:itaconate CoA-transferase
VTTPGVGPLTGVQVVGLEHSVAGPLCTRILGDMGADVIKVERPGGGDFSRHWDRNANGDGAQFWWLNRGKRSIALDLKNSPDRTVFDRLLDRADVLVHNLSPAAASRLGLSDPSFDVRFPSLVSCQISGYGASGSLRDRKAYDMLVQAESGIMSLTGTPAQPSRAGVSVCDVGTGMYAATLVLGALIEQRQTGRGRRLDVAMMDAALEFVAPMLISYANAGVLYERVPQRHHAIAPYGVFHCRDGEGVLIAVEQNREWGLMCERLLGDARLADDPRYSTNSARITHREAVDRMVADAVGALELTAMTALFDELGLAYGILNSMAEVDGHPVLRERGARRTVAGPGGREVKTLIGLGERLFAAGSDAGAPPELDQDRDAILDELGRDAGGASVDRA